MNAGRIDRLINIREQSISTARSTDGASIITFATVSSNRWAEVVPKTAEEYFTSDKRFYDADIIYSLRHTTLITETCQIYDTYSSLVYDIKEFIDKYDRHRELIVLGKIIK